MQTLEQLKAQAYDCIANREAWQKKLNEVNQQISDYNLAPTTSPTTSSEEVKEEVKEEK